MIMNMETILTKEQREENIGKIEVLDKVGKLLHLGKTEFSTVKQVAEYFEVPEDSIQRVYQRHKNEIDSDGVRYESSEEIIEKLIESGVQLKIESFSGKKIVDGIVVPNRGMKLFTKRAVLRIGMLLKKSKVAAELRTRLLDVYEAGENTPQNNGKTIVQNTFDLINEEMELKIKYAEAKLINDHEAADEYLCKLMRLKNKELQIKNNTIQEQQQTIQKQEGMIELEGLVIKVLGKSSKSLTTVLEGSGVSARSVNKYMEKLGYIQKQPSTHPISFNNNYHHTNKLDEKYYKEIKNRKYGAKLHNGTFYKNHWEDEMKWTGLGIKFILEILIKAGFIKIENGKIIKLKDII